MFSLQQILDACVPYIAGAALLGFFFALCQKMVRFLMGMIFNGKVNL